MSDNVTLKIGDREVENFTSYRIESDLYVADDAFNMELADPETEVTEGQRCRLYVGGELELNGIIDRVSDRIEKSGRKLTVEGRDLMGLLVDSCVEEFVPLSGVTIKTLAETLLKSVPYINRSAIRYGLGPKDVVKEKKEAGLYGDAVEQAQAEPGQTIFEILKDYAVARGLIFYCRPDGTAIFGRPVSSGKADFSLTLKKDGAGNDVVESSLVRDISQRYSKVTVMGQRQGGNLWEETDINYQASETDGTIPFYKPFVTQSDHDGTDPAKQAGHIMDRQRGEGWRLVCKTPGHSQNGKNWQTNAICHVTDDIRGIDENMLITGRILERSKEDGTTTTVKLSRLRPG